MPGINTKSKLSSILRLVFGVLFFALFLSVYGRDFFSLSIGNVYLINTTIAVSFFGGVLAFLSPCLGFIAPISTYFALSENKTSDYILFYLGFVALFVPIVFAGSVVALFLMPYYKYFFYLAALMLFMAAIYEFFKKSCNNKFDSASQDRKLATSFFLGISYSLTSIACTGPILGAITTLSYANGVFLLYPFILALAFALGMMVPLLAISYLPVFKKLINKGESSLFDLKIFSWQINFSGLKIFRVTALVLSGLLILFFGSIENNIYEAAAKKIFLLPGYYSLIFYALIVILLSAMIFRRKKKNLSSKKITHDL